MWSWLERQRDDHQDSLPVQIGGNDWRTWFVRCMVSTRRGYSGHNSNVTCCFTTNIPSTIGLSEGWHRLVFILFWFKHVWFFRLWLLYRKSNITPHTVENLKEKITEKIVAIPIKTCRKPYVTFRDFLQ